MENNTSKTVVAAVTADPVFFDVTRKKMIIMNLSTYGIYYLYWVYKNWVVIKESEKIDIVPFWRAFFSIFYINSLYNRIYKAAVARGFRTLATSNLALIYIVGTIVGNISARLDNQFGAFLWFAGLMIFYPILKMQEVVEHNNHEINPAFTPKAAYSLFEKCIVAIGIPLNFLGAIVIFAQLIGVAI
ncbi:MAG: hypothetical protein A3C13_03155 [Candidatus Lloydbacteria bacterium RIFCSPHIGHO2_02_FULL_50_11]|nr:MAG: hypothetical protein A3C13_03155 [Candidatus Lloydbacteria bacterium RIFCSPHIGHO2_02_FULL_50_11]